MFYLTRIIRDKDWKITSFFVKDSEDGVEEELSRDDILYCRDEGIKINGVDSHFLDKSVPEPVPDGKHKLFKDITVEFSKDGKTVQYLSIPEKVTVKASDLPSFAKGSIRGDGGILEIRPEDNFNPEALCNYWVSDIRTVANVEFDVLESSTWSQIRFIVQKGYWVILDLKGFETDAYLDLLDSLHLVDIWENGFYPYGFDVLSYDNVSRFNFAAALLYYRHEKLDAYTLVTSCFGTQAVTSEYTQFRRDSDWKRADATFTSLVWSRLKRDFFGYDVYDFASKMADELGEARATLPSRVYEKFARVCVLAAKMCSEDKFTAMKMHIFSAEKIISEQEMKLKFISFYHAACTYVDVYAELHDKVEEDVVFCREASKAFLDVIRG